MTKEQRYERILKYLAHECAPEGFGVLEKDIYEYQFEVSVERTKNEDFDEDPAIEDELEGYCRMIEDMIHTMGE